jgi:hypothetical protein
VTDGAAAVLLMTRHEALNRGLPVLGIFRSFAAVGVDPAIMGVGPAVAIPAAVEQVSNSWVLGGWGCCGADYFYFWPVICAWWLLAMNREYD